MQLGQAERAFGKPSKVRQQKLPQDAKPDDVNDIPKGIVKWLVEMLDESGEIAGIATILTMVKRKG